MNFKKKPFWQTRPYFDIDLSGHFRLVFIGYWYICWAEGELFSTLEARAI